MANKQTKSSGRMLFTVCMFAGFIFLFTPQNLTNKFQLAFAHIFSRPLSISRDFALLIQTRQSRTDVVSHSRYNQLRNQLCNLMQWLHQEHQKVERLSGLRDRTVLEGVNFVLADIITACVGGPYNELIINRGKSDGLAKGQFVLGDYSVIGIVSDIDSRTAHVKLVTDTTSKIAIKITDVNTGTIMQGNGDNCAKVELLSRKHEVTIGDVVYAQKKPGFLDVPMIVGTVAQCKTDDKNPLLWDITVKPACEVNRLKSVTVVVTAAHKYPRGDRRRVGSKSYEYLDAGGETGLADSAVPGGQ